MSEVRDKVYLGFRSTWQLRVLPYHPMDARLSEKSFVARSAASRPKQRPLRGLKTYSTLKFMRSTCGKSIILFVLASGLHVKAKISFSF